MESQPPMADGSLSFRNSQGTVARGTLMTLSRQAVVFEVYNPFSIVQMSEVLSELRIPQHKRIIYDGRAVVSGIVNTGLMLVVSATLVDPWTNLSGGEEMADEVATFVREWQNLDQAIDSGYRRSVGRLHHLLEELNLWLGRSELVAGVKDKDAPAARVETFIDQVEQATMPTLSSLFADFEEQAAQIDPPRLLVHKALARRELHPLLMCAPLLHRSFTKPLGYAGDYEMVNMLLREPREGASTYAKVVNTILHLSGCAQAHRNRIDKLVGYLADEGGRVLAAGGRPRVLNVACGPAIEVQRFMAHPQAETLELELLDFNAETLAYTRSRIQAEASRHRRQPQVLYHHRSIHDLLQEARGRGGESARWQGAFDLVYCAGLFDYLPDRICARLIELFQRWSRPGSLVVATNVHVCNPVRAIMEHLLEWHLIYRDEVQMRALAPADSQARVIGESTGINIFLEIRLPPGPPCSA